MAREVPVMIDGMRGPRQERARQEGLYKSTYSPLSPEQLVDPGKGTVYESKHRRYRVQVTTTPDTKDPNTGQVVAARQIVAKFDDFYYVNREENPALREMIDKTLQRNLWYGLNRDFWLAKDKRSADDARKIAEARDAFKENPAAVQAFLDELKASGVDFVLPQVGEKPVDAGMGPGSTAGSPKPVNLE